MASSFDFTRPPSCQAGGLPFSSMNIRYLFASALLLTASLAVGANERHVVVVVWDGMRPDFVSPENTPNLVRLSEEGVSFSRHHPVFLSSTEVNGTALATGAYPSHSGIIANNDFRPAIDSQKVVEMQVPTVIRNGDELTGGHYLGRPTMAELLQARGLTTAIAGSKQVVLLHDRSVRPNTSTSSPVLAQGEITPRSRQAALEQAVGPFPPATERDDKQARDAWTSRALLDFLWKDKVPALTLLWLAEPDSSQHVSGPGSAQSLEAIRADDAQLGLVLADLARRGLRDSTDVIVVSDHAFSTIARRVDVAVELSLAGFTTKRAAPGGLQKGDVLVVSNGGSSLIFVGGHDAAVIARLTAHLQKQDWLGVVFSRTPADGVFPMAEAHIDSPDAPDLVISLRWTSGKSANGTPGLQVSDLGAKSNKVGNHASLSSYDMHNILVAAGPDFRRGVTDTLPSANTDIAPTVLWLLGLKEEAAKMDGRVLAEALTVPAPDLRSYDLKRLSAQRELPEGIWTQYLQVAEVNGVRYLDEGNGTFAPKAATSAPAH